MMVTSLAGSEPSAVSRFNQFRVRLRQFGFCGKRHQRAVVIQQQARGGWRTRYCWIMRGLGLAGQQPRAAGGLGFLRGQQGLHEIIRPADHVVAPQPFLQQLVAPDLFLDRHRQRLFQRLAQNPRGETD